MTKKAFLAQLETALKGLPQVEIDNTLSFYREMIDDRIEEGLSEEEAIADLGSIEEIVSKVTEYTPLSKILASKIKPERRLKTWEIILLVLGAPIWASLGIAALAVIFSLWCSLWAVIISFWAVFVSLAGSAFGCILGGMILPFVGRGTEGMVAISAGLVCGGLAIFAFFVCKWLTANCLKLTKNSLLLLKQIFTKNRRTHHE